jgi:NAD(P)-dependent dehydrogenase (short-subunit alcohol dehydrogenase family)
MTQEIRDLVGRNAVVTGAGSGIGLAIARRLASDGAKVALLDRDRGAVEKAAGEIGEGAMACVADVSERAQVDAAVARVHAMLGPVHVLVNNAGIEAFDPFSEIREETWERIFAVNVRGAFNCTQAVVEDMRAATWGRIVCISSSSAQSGTARMVHYASSKAALFGFTKSLALELGPDGITVNAVAPGMVLTPMLERSAAEGKLPADIETTASQRPVRRPGRPEDIAATVAHLASEEASYVTGQIVGVGGGIYM